ncbi:MAG: HpcH/HpaI aldolase family protein [Thermomicrobiales bacterium]
MRVVNEAKKKMLAGEPAFGYSLGYGSPLVAEALAGTGIDFILLDGQHGSFGADSTIASVMAMRAGGAAPMARVTRNDYSMIGRMLDEGVLGIVIPMVDTAADAKAAADACRFPPIGTRSWGWGRAMTYGNDYADWIDEEVFVAVQIESKLAVENAEAILSTPGVDGCWMGPGDLSLSYGFRPGTPEAEEPLNRAIETVLAACRNTGTVPGYAGGSPAQGKQLAERGFRYVTAGSDIGFILSGAADGLKLLRG